MDFRTRYGPWAFVAGASMGIGAALSHEAAARGLNVAMLARGEALLREEADKVRDEHGVDVRVVPGDLAAPAIADVVAEATGDLEIGLLVYNATIAMQGHFLDVPLDDQLASVQVNCATPLALVHLFGRSMRERGRGGIGLVSSTGGTAGSVNFSTYNAGKAYQWVLAETLWAELEPSGVDVTSILVGPTYSPNFAAFQETLDPKLRGDPESADPLDRARARLFDPSMPRDVAVALYDNLADGPVCYTHPDDEYIARSTLAMPRADAVALWHGVMDTSTRTSSRTAR
ncbi:MAG TPA: SDR family NAD(P)-dependent oxidoreductase [Acidimicrobiia bacterium]|jgi:short-subunit dehydrogenase